MEGRTQKIMERRGRALRLLTLREPVEAIPHNFGIGINLHG